MKRAVTKSWAKRSLCCNALFRQLYSFRRGWGLWPWERVAGVLSEWWQEKEGQYETWKKKWPHALVAFPDLCLAGPRVGRPSAPDFRYRHVQILHPEPSPFCTVDLGGRDWWISPSPGSPETLSSALNPLLFRLCVPQAQRRGTSSPIRPRGLRVLFGSRTRALSQICEAKRARAPAGTHSLAAERSRPHATFLPVQRAANPALLFEHRCRGRARRLSAPQAGNFVDILGLKNCLIRTSKEKGFFMLFGGHRERTWGSPRQRDVVGEFVPRHQPRSSPGRSH